MVYTGIGGSVGASKIGMVEIIFDSNIGKHIGKLDWLSISNKYAEEGKQLPQLSSMLGIDILQRFDILFENEFAYLWKK